MPTPTAEHVIDIDEKIITAINALGQLGIGALVIVCVIFALVTFIVYLRLRYKSEESDGRRIEENSKILMQFADLVRQADLNREKALDSRNSETAQAINQSAVVMATALEASRKVIENNTAVQVKQEEHRAELKSAILEMVDQQKATRTDIKEWPSAVISAMGVLEKELKKEISDLQQKVSEALAKCTEKEDTTMLDILKDILAGVNTLNTNQRELTELLTRLREMYESAVPPSSEGKKIA